jgi:hypothetical protein
VRLKRILGRTIVVTAAAAGFAVLIGRARGTEATTSLAWDSAAAARSSYS